MQHPHETRGTRAFHYRHDPATDTWVPFSVKVTNGGLDVNIQDQHTEVIDLFLIQKRCDLTLNSGIAINDRVASVNSSLIPQTGDYICFKEGTAFYQASVLSRVAVSTGVSGSGDWNLIVDTPFDYAFTTGGVFALATREMNISGSTGSPQEFMLSPSGLNSGVSWDIVRVLFSITDQQAMDDNTFGGIISGLDNGIVFRTENGITKNIFNIKKNGEFAIRNHDLIYADKAPAGYYGLRSHRDFGGQGNNGVTLRLDAAAGDCIKLIIQDSLTGLSSFHVIAQGHVVE